VLHRPNPAPTPGFAVQDSPAPLITRPSHSSSGETAIEDMPISRRTPVASCLMGGASSRGFRWSWVGRWFCRDRLRALQVRTPVSCWRSRCSSAALLRQSCFYGICSCWARHRASISFSVSQCLGGGRATANPIGPPAPQMTACLFSSSITVSWQRRFVDPHLAWVRHRLAQLPVAPRVGSSDACVGAQRRRG
jgi:hypothetical protein